MKILIYIAALVISTSTYAESSITSRKVECEGSTVIEVDGHIGAQTPFRAVFSIEGDVVNMVEGDVSRFSKSYKANEEITKPDRPGYHSENGNLFFYKTSGRFEIFKLKVVSSGLKTEKTSGQCKKFTPSNAFQ
ncbi:hypothetical protein V6259_18830 [Marinomonas sp. TI.3.20]|uniref:hypothetical protein n=1 Tax=Marinomonas sp. TI.3.20 TaxID=3121296 RepID=UPI00311E4594